METISIETSQLKYTILQMTPGLGASYIEAQPQYYQNESKSNEWVIMSAQTGIRVYDIINPNKSTWRWTKQYKSSLLKNTDLFSIQCALNMKDDLLFVFNPFGVMKCLDLNNRKWTDKFIIKNPLKGDNKFIGCYLSSPYDCLYFIDRNNFDTQFKYDCTTKQLISMNVKFIGYFEKLDTLFTKYKLIYCASLNALFLLEKNKIYYSLIHEHLNGDIGWMYFGQTTEFNLETSCSVLIYEQILMIFCNDSMKNIYFWDLYSNRKYKSDKTCPPSPSHNDIWLYGICKNNNIAYICSQFNHIKVEVKDAIPNKLYKDYVDLYDLLLDGYLKQIENELNIFIPTSLAKQIKQFYPIFL